MDTRWLNLDKNIYKYLQTPIIYFNPKHKKIFFNKPYGFESGDHIDVQIRHDKKALRFRLVGNYRESLKFSEFKDKTKGSITCALLFSEFPELFANSNKYQSEIFIEEKSISNYTLIIDLTKPLEIGRKMKKDHKEIEQLALDLADKKEKHNEGL